MGYRNLKNIDDKILDMVLEVGSKIGPQKVTAVKVAEKLDVSNFLIFDHFKTKKNLIDQAAIHFEKKMMRHFQELVIEGVRQEDLFDGMLDFLIKEAYGTLYYSAYVRTYGYDPTMNNPHALSFMPQALTFFGIEEGSHSTESVLFIWDYVTSIVKYYAEMIIRGHFPNTGMTKRKIRSIVFKGLQGYFEEN